MCTNTPIDASKNGNENQKSINKTEKKRRKKKEISNDIVESTNLQSICLKTLFILSLALFAHFFFTFSSKLSYPGHTGQNVMYIIA